MNPKVTWDAGQLSRPSPASQSKGSNISLLPLPKSPAPSIPSVRYDPGERPSTVIITRIRGRWIAQTCTDGNTDGLADLAGPLEVIIEVGTVRWMVAKSDILRPIFLADGNASKTCPSRSK